MCLVPSCSPEPELAAAPTPLAITAPSPHIASLDARARVPSFIWADPSQRGTNSAVATATPDAAARMHLQAYGSIYRLNPRDVDALELRDLHDTGQGPIIARYGRRIDGVEVWNEVISIAMDRDRQAIAVAGFVTGDAPTPSKARGTPFSLPPARAAAAAFTALGQDVSEASLGAPIAAEGDFVELSNPVSAQPVRARKTWFRTDDHRLVDAWYLEVDHGFSADGTPQWFSYVVSATDGAVLFKNDLTANDHPVTYRLWADVAPLPIPQDGPQGNATSPLPGASLNNFNPPFLSPSLLTIASLRNLGVFDDWLPAGATETLGNNVDAYVDIVSPDGFTPGADFRADVTAANTFDRVFDTTQAPTVSVNQQKAAITQLFYNVNFWHDWYYVAGFDERAGNAQSSNYGRGGVQGDPIRGEAQDSSSRNNANMSTPSDGARPRMQMFLWDYSAASLTMTTPVPATYANLGLPSGWSQTNFTLPASTPFSRSNPAEACTALTGAVAGTIVIADRGTCGFSVKAANAQAAGAAGIIIANVAASANPTVAPGMALTAGQTPPTIPAFSVNLADGNTLRTQVGAGPMTGGMSRTTEVRDGDIDNSVMAHEWGHYISNRLVFNANGLGSNMSRGLGEGWADTHAMLMTVRAGDDLEPTNATWNGVYAAAAYSAAGFARGNPYYYGIRRYPYSTDMTKNPLTFKHIGDGNALPVGPPVNGNTSTNSEVHNTGEVWATMLWECYAALLRDTQGGSPRFTFDQARDRWRNYLVAAYKMTPSNPTLLQARDALLAVALATDPVDYSRFTVAFAKRGAGVFAVAPDINSANNMPVVESFSVGAALAATTATLTDDVTPQCNRDNVLDNGEQGTVTLTFRNVGSAALAPSTATVSSSVPGITFPLGNTVAIPAAAQFQAVTTTVRVAMSGLAPGPTAFDLTVNAPDLGAGAPPPKTFSFLGNYDVVPNGSFTDTVEAPNTAWQVVNAPTSLGQAEMWQRTAIAINDHRWTGPSASQAGTSDLVSPAVFALPGQPLIISFRHRFSFESPVFDGGVIEISTDGGVTWVDLGTALAGYNGTLGNASNNPLGGRPAFVNQSTGYPAFANVSLNLGTAYAGKQVQVRFCVASDAGTSSAGWDIDDLQFSGISAMPFDALVPQPAVCNNAPVANAGLSGPVNEFTASPAFGPVTVTLDGSASQDADGQALTYQWVQVAGPAVTLSSTTARQPTFTAPTIARAASPVRLTFQLVVSDGTSSSQPDYVIIGVNNVNRPPVANAGPAQSVNERVAVTLDGTASADPDADDTLTYSWTQTAGPTVTLSSTTAAQPTFTAPSVTAATVLTFRLVVNDGLASSATSTVNITVGDVNQAPVANAGTGQTVAEFTASPTFGPVTVTLDGTGSSDPDGNTLTYAWTQTGGPTVTLSDATVSQPTFVAPSVPRAGTTILTFRLVVNDGTVASPPITTTVTVTNVNRPPTAAAGPAQTVDERATATLDGTGSTDPDSDDTLTYAWTQTAGPTATLTGATTATPTFTVPEVTATTTLTFQLVVSDGLVSSAASTVSLSVNNVNRAAVANAGAAQSVPEFTGSTFGATTVTLDGSASSDPDGDTVTYAWTQTAGPTVVLSSATAAQPTFVAPAALRAMPTVLVFQLIASDGTLASAPATTTVTVTNVNRPPVANAGAAQMVAERGTATLDGSASADPDADDTLTYAWTQTAGPTVTLSSATAAGPTFTAPEVMAAGTDLVFQLIVNDGLDASVASTVTVHVTDVNRAPVAMAGPAQTVDERTMVTLAGSATDPDGDSPLTYQWTAPTGVTLSDATSAAPTFTAPDVAANTVLTFSLVVSDPSGAASPAATVDVTVTNVNRAPVANAGSDASAGTGTLVALHGSATDPDGDTAFTWAWTAPAGVTLIDPTSATPTFIAPAVTTDQTFTFSLVVTDAGGLASAAASVTITVTRAHGKPIANAGTSVVTTPGATVTLDASGSSDPDGRALTAAWSQVSGPHVDFDAAATRPTFVAPDATEDTVLTFSLTVSNGTDTSEPATVSVFVKAAKASGCGCATGTGSGQLWLLAVPLLALLSRRRRR
ncbi:MAG: myxosortase-dependent M36 family metallopeptidase [Myxococcaceae bacterium]